MPSAAQNFNLPSPTIGGKQLWTDLLIHHDWRIQRNALTGHCRLLDGKNFRRAWGSWEGCRRRFDQLQRELELPPMPSKIVITLHGLGRSRRAMAGIGKYLKKEGGYGWINMSYASTRQPIDDHAKALASVINHLQGAEEINFVAHSLGNLVIRRYLADQATLPEKHANHPRLGRIVMLAPPNNGASFAVRLKDLDLFRLIFGQSGVQLARQWEQLEKRLATPDCEFGILAGAHEKKWIANPLLQGDNDLVVTVEETRLPGASDFLVAPIGHTFMMDNDQVREQTLRFLQHGYFISAEQRQPIAAPAATSN